MDFILFICITISLYKASVNKRDFFTDYCSYQNTTAINGLFVILVFLSHFSSYIKTDSSVVYPLLSKVLGQLIVAPFFLYSGYGVMKAIEQKGDTYIKTFGLKRIIRMWFHFAMALFIFLAIALIRKTKYKVSRILLSFVGLSSVGNSNWFMFTLFCLYIMTLISSVIFMKRKRTIPFAVSVFIVLLMIVMKQCKMAYYYYDTAFAYAFGMLYEQYEDKLRHALAMNNRRYYTSLIVLCLCFIGASFWRSKTHWISSFVVWVSIFSLLLLLFSMKFKSNNRLLMVLGQYSFEIYILQRIPMNLLYKSIPNLFVFFIASGLLTGIISYLFRKTELYVDRYVFNTTP